MKMLKTVKTREEAYIDFSDEEMQELNLKKGDKFEWTDLGDGSFKLEKWVEMELDIEDFPIEVLWMLIKHSFDNDCTMNETFNELLTKAMEEELP
jgi:hypothetical protein